MNCCSCDTEVCFASCMSVVLGDNAIYIWMIEITVTLEPLLYRILSNVCMYRKLQCALFDIFDGKRHVHLYILRERETGNR